MQLSGTSLATTAPAATTDPEPMWTPGVIVAFAPIQTLEPMAIGAVVMPSKRSVGSTGWPAVSSMTGADHRAVPDGHAAEVMEGPVLVDEDAFAELQVEAVIAVERWVEGESPWHGPAENFREQRGPGFEIAVAQQVQA